MAADGVEERTGVNAHAARDDEAALRMQSEMSAARHAQPAIDSPGGMEAKPEVRVQRPAETRDSAARELGRAPDCLPWIHAAASCFRIADLILR